MKQKQQTSLSSFFGASSSSSSSSPQSSTKVPTTTVSKDNNNNNDENNLNSDNQSILKKKEEDMVESSKRKMMNDDTKVNEKSTKSHQENKQDLMDTDEDDDDEMDLCDKEISTTKKVIRSKKNNNDNTTNNDESAILRKTKKAKLIIQDDEDDDDDEENDVNEKEVKEQVVDIVDKNNDDNKSIQKPTPQPKAQCDNKKPLKNAFAILKERSTNNTTSSNTEPSISKKSPTIMSSTKHNNTKNDGEWTEGTPIPYSTLTQTLSAIEAITGRLEIQGHLTNLFAECIEKYPQDLITLVYLASNSVAPAYECVELGIGDAILIKAVAEASGSNANVIKQKYEADGDLGTVALTAKGKQRTLGFGVKPKPLKAQEVLKVYRQIAAISGSQSQKMKVDMIKGLLVRATQKGDESKYIIRGLQGKLRIGLAQSTVLISLAHAVLSTCQFNKVKKDNNDDEEDLSVDCQNVKNTKSAKETRLESAVNIVKKAYSEVSSFDALVEALISTPLWELHKSCSLRPGYPVTPMLAKPTKSIQEVLKRLNGKRFTCEYKYDGERAQVHMQNDGVTKVFSRSLLDTSEKFPEVPKYVKEACVGDVKSFILDTEVVAYNRETKQFVPFQVLSTRKKTEESDDNAKVKVIVQAFDLMYLNGESLLDRTLAERRDLLLKHFQVVDGKFQFATSLDHKEDGDTTLIEDFLDAAVKGQCEGLMVKTLDENASYQPSYRSLNWLKLKKDYLEGMGDSVDLVPIGAYHGRGKRTGVYGAYLLACYDLDTEEFQSVCKIGTGFSDEDLKTLSDGLKNKIIKEKSSQYNVSSSLECDVWFEACQVWEVKAADLSKSSTHKGAIDKTGESGRGIGLRFPRFERLRDDKKPEHATTSDQILEMYYAQDSIVDDGAGGDYGDDGI